MSYTILHGDCIEQMRTLADNSVDAVVTDPPYELGFMGRSWDRSGIANNVEMWREVLRVLKPGGHLLASGGTRTYHRMACAIEDAGFEIRDCLQWLYGSGFPKSLDVSKAIDKAAGAEREVVGVSATHTTKRMNGGAYNANHDRESIRALDITAPATSDAERWQGWGTALKPSVEPVVLARKPLSERTVAANVLRWGTGALNIDGCRIETSDNLNGGAYSPESEAGHIRRWEGGEFKRKPGRYEQPPGRWPANVLLDEDAAELLDAMSGERKSGGYPPAGSVRSRNATYGEPNERGEPMFGKSAGGPSRYFYVAKASRKERRGSTHPTVKPVALMRYLVRLITPPGGVVLDPFAGSGTTGEACTLEGFDCILIEREAEYIADIRARFAAVQQPLEMAAG